MATEQERARELQSRLYDFALGLPEAWPDTPWGDSVVKVGKKIFAFFGSGGPGITVKLPESADHALSFPGAEKPGYGLGAHGWVHVPLLGLSKRDGEVLFDFIDESYRTIAPKKLVKLLDARADTV